MRILISGASIAGPAAAYWFSRCGHTVTVVERTPGLRKTGGHAVDLFRPALVILERMGVLAEVQDRATGIDRGTIFTPGARRPVEVRIDRLAAAATDRHVEIMRDDLSEVLVARTLDDVEYLFGDSIVTVSAESGEVTFEQAGPRSFDLIIGADGLHSNVRSLVFGDESRFSSFLGAYLAVYSLPNYLELDRRRIAYLGVGRLAATYSARHLDDARALFLFHTDLALEYDRHDVARQKELLRAVFSGMGGEVTRWLEELDRAPAFYFDAITQLTMDTWSRERVTLVGDAGYCPGPVVGGSASLAVVGSYVLAGELAEADGDYERAFIACEQQMGDSVRASRSLARRAARTLIPTSQAQIWALAQSLRMVSHLPARPIGAVARLADRSLSVAGSMAVKDYAGMHRS
jgi:2-polyprenyl-6-methoxyphenol hydroxylase-like FAD-dependent oxidoreductase